MVVKPLALALLLAGVSFGLGQEGTKRVRVAEEEDLPKKKGVERKEAPPKSKLEEMLAEALKNNPDIRVAVAKAAEAEAELNRTRLQVTQKVIALHHALLSQKAAVEYAQRKYDRMKTLGDRGAIDSALLEEAQEAFATAKAKLAEVEAQAPALLGKTAYNFDFDGAEAAALRVWLNSSSKLRLVEAKKATGPMADKIRAALGKSISVKMNNTHVGDVLLHLQQVTDITIKRMVNDQPEPQLSLELTNLPLAAVLQYIEDSEPSYRFVVREYGLLFGPQAKLPPGAVTVQEFMRQPKAAEPRGQETKPQNPPAENVEGLVKQIDSSGLVHISIGRDAGLALGHTLELFRLSEEPSKSKYLGRIRIVETQPDEAVGKPVGRMAETPKVGDRVASRILGK
jgi:hypothetical protein